MTPLTDAELTVLLDAGESDRAERKSAWAGDAPEKVRQAVCAFANDLPGHGLPGVVFVGARDDGAPSGIVVDEQLLLTLADIKTDGKILPPPVLTVERRELKGSAMAVVTVWPADAPPVRHDGRTWIRIGPRRGLASAQDERILNEKRRHFDRAFDTQPIRGCSLAELSRVVFEQEYKLKGALTTAVDYTSGTTEVRKSPYPLSALQQLIRNAVMHRTYENTNAPVRVYWFDDRIEIYSPGGPYGTVTRENFGRPGVSDYRNAALAAVLKTLGYVQRFGVGIAEARRALAGNGNPPLEFDVQPTMVLAVVRGAP